LVLFTWLERDVRSQNCQQLTLDAGIPRFAVQQFLLNHRLDITSDRFTLQL
jgi:hypothetical protein